MPKELGPKEKALRALREARVAAAEQEKAPPAKSTSRKPRRTKPKA